MSMDKPKLDRNVLESHGITYVENVILHHHQKKEIQSNQVESELPDHVEYLREALLNFGSLFPESFKEKFEKDLEYHQIITSPQNSSSDNKGRNTLPPASVYFRERQGFPTRSITSAIAADEVLIDENAEVAKQARNLTAKNASERDWVLFMSTRFFKTFEAALPSPTEHDQLFDQWSLESDMHWNEARKYANFDQSITQPTDPKPDLTYGFPINNVNAPHPIGFQREESVGNFSHEVLASLCSEGIISAPHSRLRTWTNNRKRKLSGRDLICFPWAVVELKRANMQQNEIQFCFCQAANGASAALEIYENLSKSATGKIDSRIPPIVAFTCIGPEVKVWLAYSCARQNQANCHKMVCIWGTTLNAIWGVIATHLIIRNMHIWASRVLKPKLSNYISQVRSNLREKLPVNLDLTLEAQSVSAPAQQFPLQDRRNAGILSEESRAPLLSLRDAPVPELPPTVQSDEAVFCKPLRELEEASAKPLPPSPEDRPVPEVPVQNVAASDISSRDLQGQSMASQNRADQDKPAQIEESQDMPARNTLIRNLSNLNPVIPDPTTQNRLTQDIEAQDSLTDDSVAPKAAAEDTATQDIPAQGTPVQDTPGPETPRRKVLVPKTRIGPQVIPFRTMPSTSSRYDFGLGDIAAPILHPRFIWKPEHFAEASVERNMFIRPSPLMAKRAENLTRGPTIVPPASLTSSPPVLQITWSEGSGKNSLDDSGDLGEENGREKPEIPKLLTKADLENDAGLSNPSEAAAGCDNTNDLDQQPTAKPQADRTSYQDVDNEAEDSTDSPDEDKYTEYVPDLHHYRRYRLKDHFTRWLDLDAYLDSEYNSSDDHSYNPSESGSDESEELEELEEFRQEVYGDMSESREEEFEELNEPDESDEQLSVSSKHFSHEIYLEDNDHSIILERDINEWNSRALVCLWGPEFVRLDAVVGIIKRLSGTSLLDATWRALEQRKITDKDSGHGSIRFKEILQQLSQVLGLSDESVITYNQVLAGEKWELVDQALQTLQISGDDKLRSVLSNALQCWDGEMNVELLSPELEELSHEEWSDMGKQALETLQASSEAR